MTGYGQIPLSRFIAICSHCSQRCLPVFFCCLASLFSFPLLASDREQLLEDPGFFLGYNIIKPRKTTMTEKPVLEARHQLDDSREPVWNLAQWGSDISLAGAYAVGLPDGGKRWTASRLDENNKPHVYKSVALHRGEDAGATLELNGLEEFSGEFYSGVEDLYLQGLDDYWPHLLMGQNLVTRRLSDYDRLTFSLQAKLLFDNRNLKDGYKKSLHAARFPVAILVRNLFSQHSFWLMLVIYDDRFEKSGFGCRKCRGVIPPENPQQECFWPESIEDEGAWYCPFDGKRWSKDARKKGTRKMVFRVATSEITGDNIHGGDWAAYQVDLLPYIRSAIDAARDQGSLRGFSMKINHYDLSYFSLGWEITGLNHAAIRFRNLKLEGVLKEGSGL